MKLDQQRYQQALKRARLALSAAGAIFDEVKHPRDANGRWAHVSFGKSMQDSFDVNDRKLPTDTQDLHTYRDQSDGKWKYTAERGKLHKAIIEHFLGDKKPASGKPTVTFTAGGTASGKSSVVGESIPVHPDVVHVDPDAIKAMLPEYRAMVRAGEDRAAPIAHEESADIAKALTSEASRRGMHLLIEGTGASAPGNNYADAITRLHGQGYDAHVHYVTVPTSEAIKRADKRAKDEGRKVPEQSLRYIHTRVSQVFPEIAALAESGKVKQLTVHDNTSTRPVQIAHLEGGKVVHDKPDEMRAFLAKAREHVPRRHGKA